MNRKQREIDITLACFQLNKFKFLLIVNKLLTMYVQQKRKTFLFSFKEMAKVSAAQAVVDAANEVEFMLVFYHSLFSSMS